MAKIIAGYNCETNLEGATFAYGSENQETVGVTGLSYQEITWLRIKGYGTANQKDRERLLKEVKKASANWKK